MKGFIVMLVGTLCAACAPRGSMVGTRPQPLRVVLVHGFGETGDAFSYLKYRLEKRGMDCFVPRMKPADGQGGLARLARNLKRDIDARYGPEARIAVVGFSMGGIVSRYYLQELGGAERCDALITISSPHHGTKVANWYPTQGAAEMRPGSPFLKDLETSTHRLGRMPVASYRTRMDLVIVPPTSSVWSRADNVEYPVALHPLMLASPRVVADIERRLIKVAAGEVPGAAGD